MGKNIIAGCSFGLLLGVMVGMSKSPVVGTVLGALCTVVVAVLGAAPRAQEKDRAFGDPAWITSFAFTCLLGLFAGVYVRTHDLLSPRLEERVAQLRELGIDDKEIASVLVKTFQETTSLALKLPNDGQASAAAQASVLFAGLSKGDVRRADPAQTKKVDDVLDLWRHSGALFSKLEMELRKVALVDLSEEKKREVLVAIYTAVEETSSEAK